MKKTVTPSSSSEPETSAYGMAIAWLTRTSFGGFVLAILLIGAIVLLYKGYSIWGITAPAGAGAGTSKSDQLAVFDKELDKHITTVYKLLSEEANKHGKETQYFQTLNYMVLQLTDIKTVRVDEMRGRCNGDAHCIGDEIALKRNDIKQLSERCRVPLLLK